MRVSSIFLRQYPRFRWGPLASAVNRVPRNPPAAVTNLEEYPAPTGLGQRVPAYRRFKPVSQFSIYKMNEVQRTIDEAGHYKLVFFAPVGSLVKIKDAIFATGAGKIGNYTRCSFQTLGTGQFRPEVGSAPTVGQIGMTEVVEEIKCEILCKGKKTTKAAVRALLHTHPYEVPAYEVYKTEFGFEPHQVALTPHRQLSPVDIAGIEKITNRISQQFTKADQIKVNAQKEEQLSGEGATIEVKDGETEGVVVEAKDSEAASVITEAKEEEKKQKILEPEGSKITP